MSTYPLELPIRRVARAIRLNKLLARARGWRTPFFTSATPDTPPAITASMERLADQGFIDGDYLEFGVYRGYTLWHATRVASHLRFANMRFFGFDSFEGLPEPVGVDSGWRFSKGQYACGIDDVRANLSKKKVDWGRTVLVPGYYDSSLTSTKREELGIETSALVLVDCDLYSSTVDALEFIQPTIKEGTIILFDDWNCFDEDPSHGERRAFAEFLERNPQLKAEEFISFGWHGQSFIMHMANPAE